MDNIAVTTDTSSLVQSTGYWSEKKVLFNNTHDQLVILRPELTASDLCEIISKHIQKTLPELVQEALDTKKFVSGSGSALLLTSVDELRQQKWMYHGKVSVKKLYEDLGEQYVPYVSQAWVKSFQHKPWKGINCLHKTIAKTSFWASAYIAWDDLQIESSAADFIKTLYWLSEMPAPSANIGRTQNKENAEKAWDSISEEIKEAAAFFFNHENADFSMAAASTKVRMINCLRYATSQALCYLLDAGVLLLPCNSTLDSSIIITTDKCKNTYRDLGNGRVDYLISRLVTFTTINSTEDIPANLRECFDVLELRSGRSNTTAGGIIKAIVKHLQAYAERNDLPHFPIQNIGRNQFVKHRAYSLGWFRENLPPQWFDFAQSYYLSSNSSDGHKANALSVFTRWAWQEQKIEDPLKITANMLRNHYDLSDRSTFFIFLRDYPDVNPDFKWNAWHKASTMFKAVEEDAKLPGSPLHGKFKSNPFNAYSKVPFKKKGSSQGKTPRARMLESAQEAMVDMLLSPDENGIPTFSWARENLSVDYVDVIDPSSGDLVKVWCPSRVCCLAVLMLTPMRQAQARWLDQGLMDDEIYDPESGGMVKNTHLLSGWRYSNGNSHQEQYGRASGVLQMIHDPFTGTESLGIFTNTNKTQMWDGTKRTGYEFPWPDGSDLLEKASWTTETVGLTDAQREEVGRLSDAERQQMVSKAHWFNRIYQVIQYQIEWMQRYDPDPHPISFKHTTNDRLRVDSANEIADSGMPWFVPLFRDPLNMVPVEGDGEQFNAMCPVSKAKLNSLYNRLAVETEERLAEEGIDIRLSIEGGTSLSWKGKVCRYNLHSMRVSGISSLFEKGVPAHIIQEYIAGHSVIASTFHYLKHHPTHVRESLLNAIADGELFDDWNSIIDQLKSGQVNVNDVFARSRRYQDDIDEIPDDFSAFCFVEGGICPMGGKGSRCHQGGVVENISEGGAKAGEVFIEYGPVQGGCGNCRFWMTGPALLMEQSLALNTLMLKLRAMGRERKELNTQLITLEGDIDDLDSVQNFDEVADLSTKKIAVQEQILAAETCMEPLILEWYNRYELFMDSQSLAEQQIETGVTSLALFSSNNNLDFTPEMMETTDFGLVRQAVEQARYFQRKGVVIPDDAGRLLREFMDKIMVEHDPKNLLLRIKDTKLATHAASVMASYISDLVGDEAAQHAIDNGEPLKLPVDENGERRPLDEHTQSKLEGLLALISDTARNGEAPTFKTLEPKLPQAAIETDVA